MLQLSHMLDRQMLDVKYLKLEVSQNLWHLGDLAETMMGWKLETVQREKRQLERDNLQLRKWAEELELQAHQRVEVARRDERASLLAELRVGYGIWRSVLC